MRKVQGRKGGERGGGKRDIDRHRESGGERENDSKQKVCRSSQHNVRERKSHKSTHQSHVSECSQHDYYTDVLLPHHLLGQRGR